MTDFVALTLTGTDSEKFLQGQLTANVAKIGTDFVPSAICNLKGRVQFGLWVRGTDDGYQLVLASDLADDLIRHIKKYGAFSKISLSAPTPIYPALKDGAPSFGETASVPFDTWAQASVAQGNYWLNKATSEAFQPQELRLHQRGGVDYDKGCYLGQEIVARLYFKASPKAYLHRIAGTGQVPSAGGMVGKASIVNAVATDAGYEALVIARPDELDGLAVLPLPTELQADVGRH